MGTCAPTRLIGVVQSNKMLASSKTSNKLISKKLMTSIGFSQKYSEFSLSPHQFPPHYYWLEMHKCEVSLLLHIETMKNLNIWSRSGTHLSLGFS